MYTGIVQGLASVRATTSHTGHKSITLTSHPQLFGDIKTGASVAIDGTCLTVTQHGPDTVSFDISEITAVLTTLKNLKVGDEVNVERSHKFMEENGGHNLYGHIDGVAEVMSWEDKGETARVVIKVPETAIHYFFQKGFIGVHGCSLTIESIDEKLHTLSLNLIPETLRTTNLRSKKVGDGLNYEIDQTTRTLVDTIKRTLSSAR